MRTASRALLFTLLTSCTPAAPPPPADTPTPVPVPPAAPTTISLRVAAPGLDALDVERDITTQLEQALAGIPGLDRVRSVSRNEAATLVLTLAPGTASDPARTAVYEQLNNARAVLPADIIPITTAELAPRAHAVHFVLTGDRPATDLHTLASRLRDELRATTGVAAVELCGGREPHLQIAVDPARLAAYALGLEVVLTGLRTSLSDAPLAPGLQARIAAGSVEDLNRLVVKPGAPVVTLGDVARISVDAGVPACDAVQLGGAGVVLGTVLAHRSADPGAFNSDVQARLVALRATLPPGLELRIPRLERVALELLATAPGDTVPLAARALSTALTGSREAYLQAPTLTAPRAPVDAELLLAPIDPADPDALAAALAGVPGVKVRALDGDLDAVPRAIVQGEDLETCARIADDLATIARKLPGVRHVDVRWAMDPELSLDVRREALARFGVVEAELRAVMTAALTGITVGTLRQGDQTLPVRVQLGEPTPPDPAARVASLGALQLPTAAGSVPLSELVSFRVDQRPHAIVRVDRHRVVEVELQLREPAALAALQTAMAAELRLPPGYSVRFDQLARLD